MEPRLAIVRGVAAIVRRVLLCGEFDPEKDNLQRLGGTSIEAVHVLSLLEIEYGENLSFEDLWGAATIASIADRIQAARRCAAP